MTNDAFVSGDGFRTAAAEASWGDYSIGFNLWTYYPPYKEFKNRDKSGTIDYNYESPIWRKNPHGTYSDGRRIYAGLYLGYSNGFMSSRSGIDAPWVQDFFQNGIHRWIVKGPYFNTNLGPAYRFFSQSFINNPWGLY